MGAGAKGPLNNGDILTGNTWAFSATYYLSGLAYGSAGRYAQHGL